MNNGRVNSDFRQSRCCFQETAVKRSTPCSGHSRLAPSRIHTLRFPTRFRTSTHTHALIPRESPRPLSNNRSPSGTVLKQCEKCLTLLALSAHERRQQKSLKVVVMRLMWRVRLRAKRSGSGQLSTAWHRMNHDCAPTLPTRNNLDALIVLLMLLHIYAPDLLLGREGRRESENPGLYTPSLPRLRGSRFELTSAGTKRRRMAERSQWQGKW